VEAAQAFGAQAILTSHAHRSGTDRMAEVARNTNGDIYVNIQGDEPLLNPEAVDRAVQPLLDDPSVMMSSLYCHAQPEDYEAPSVVKVVVDQNGDALYFSRSRIPYPRETTEVPVLRHIGLYVFRRALLLQYAQWEPTPLECTEIAGAAARAGTRLQNPHGLLPAAVDCGGHGDRPAARADDTLQRRFDVERGAERVAQRRVVADDRHRRTRRRRVARARIKNVPVADAVYLEILLRVACNGERGVAEQGLAPVGEAYQPS
jgi:hypothetical protein